MMVETYAHVTATELQAAVYWVHDEAKYVVRCSDCLQELRIIGLPVPTIDEALDRLRAHVSMGDCRIH